MLGWVRNLFARKSASPAVSVRGRYDNAQSTTDNRGLWQLTDILSAKSANNFQVRRTLRMRSRYEYANNSWFAGIVNTSANDLISTGPTLQVTTPDKAVNRQVEAAWRQWARAVGFTERLRTSAVAKRVDGESFLVLTTNEAIRSPVKLYLSDLEADQVTTPTAGFQVQTWIDGLKLDQLGNPVAYYVLNHHPGDLVVPTMDPLKGKWVPARHVLHWFRKDRPGQVRGVPELTPALELFGEMRRYRRAVLGAAETAASFAAFLKTSGPAVASEELVGKPFETQPIERDLLMTLPEGYDLSQLRAEQPTTTFDSFQEKLLSEACRTLNVPLNVALGTSQKFNFSSARLDHLNYHASLRIERQQCEGIDLDPLLVAWLDEAVMIPGLLPDGLNIDDLPHEWHWPGFPYMDPLTDAQADTERLTNGTQTYARYYAERGLDWEEEFEQRAIERERMESLGLAPADSDDANGDGTDSGTEEEVANAA